MKLMQLRASSLPLGFLCPASVREPNQKVRKTIEGADTGSAAHELLRRVAENSGVPWAQVAETAERWGVKEDELRVLCALGQRLWEAIGDHFWGAQTEVYFSSTHPGLGFELTGHMDLLSIDGDTAHIGDWKTGRVDGSYKAQLLGYALLTVRNTGVAKTTSAALWVRDESVEKYDSTAEQLDQFAIQIGERIVDWDGTYYPGDHCGLCPRRHECSAKTSHERAAVAAFVVDSEASALTVDGVASLSTDRTYLLYKQAKLVEKLAKDVMGAIRKHVRENGPIVSHGKSLKIVEERRKTVHPLRAWPILENHGFTDEELNSCVKISKSDMTKAAAALAGRDKGAAAVRQLMADLEAAEAVSETIIEKLEERRV